MSPDDTLHREDVALLLGRKLQDVKNDLHHENFVCYYGKPHIIPIDVVINEIFHMFVNRAHLKPSAVRLCLPGFILVLPGAIDKPDTHIVAAVSKKNTLACAAGTAREILSYGIQAGPEFAATWWLPLSEPVNNIRKRAAEHGILLPDKFCPTRAPALASNSPVQFRAKSGVVSEWSPAVKLAGIPTVH